MDIDGAGVACVLVAPDFMEQLVAGQHGAAIAYQADKQIELLGLQFEILTAIVDPPASEIDAQWTCNKIASARAAFWLTLRVFGWRMFFAGGWIVGPAQESTDAGEQLPASEGLGHIIVGPNFQANDLINFVTSGCQHNDGNGRHCIF